MADKPRQNRFLRAMNRTRMFFGPAQISRGAGRSERSEEQRREDLHRLKLRRIVNPDGTSYLVADTNPDSDSRGKNSPDPADSSDKPGGNQQSGPAGQQ